MGKYLENEINALEKELSKGFNSKFNSVLETTADVAGHVLMPGTYNALKTSQEIVGDISNTATNLIAEPISNAINVDQRAVNAALQLAAGAALGNGNGNGLKNSITYQTRQSLGSGVANKFQRLRSKSPNKVANARSGLLINKTEVGAVGDVSAKYRSISNKDAELLREQVERAVIGSNFTRGKMDLSDRLLITPPQEIARSPIAYAKTAHKKVGMEQHHLLPKMQVAEIYRRLLQVGDIDDLSNMMSWMTQAGNHAGDRLNALLLMNPKPHRITHGLAKKKGLEPSNRMKLRKPLSLLKTRQEVFEFMDNYIKTNLKPSKELFIKAQKDFENLSTQAQSELLQYLAAIRERGS